MSLPLSDVIRNSQSATGCDAVSYIYSMTFAKYERSKWAAEKKKRKEPQRKEREKKKNDFCESVISVPNENFR